MISLINANFITSATSAVDSIDAQFLEVAFLGRSNVGKSSIINALTNKKKLALSSQTPGKTKLINFFDITYKQDEDLYRCRFVDLPGFGYAKVSKQELKNWEQNLSNFIEKRRSIRLFIHLIDSRHTSLEIDKNVQEYLQNIKRADQEILQILTKSDKLNQKAKSEASKAYPNSLMVSAMNKTGINKANLKIFELLFGKTDD